MKNIFVAVLCVLAILSFATCNNENITPDTPQGEYVRLSFTTTEDTSKVTSRAVWSDENGKGNLIFNWESDLGGSEMVALLSNGTKLIRNYPSKNPSTEELMAERYHTYMTIIPKDDRHKANFTTLRYYNTNNMATATDVFAVTPVCDISSIECNGTAFNMKMEMPGTFTQSFSQQPDFLSDYMLMYGHGMFENGEASIPFKHIPATFRFIITNNRPANTTIGSMQMTIDGNASIGSKYNVL